MIGGKLSATGIMLVNLESSTSILNQSRPPPSAALFEDIIVKAPILQIVNVVLALFMLSLEWPLPFYRGTVLHRSLILRLVLLIFMAFTNSQSAPLLTRQG